MNLVASDELNPPKSRISTYARAPQTAFHRGDSESVLYVQIVDLVSLVDI